MFNSPFHPFHKIVAEAKEEREQLDRLLTISAPRERALVAVIALVLIVFAAWLFFGNVARSVVTDGLLVEPGADLSGANRSLQAVIWLERDVAQQIGAGMPALVEVTTTDGEERGLDGKVVTIATVPMSDQSALPESAAPISLHRVNIALGEDLDFAYLDGTECTIVIKLGKYSPVSLLGLGRS